MAYRNLKDITGDELAWVLKLPQPVHTEKTESETLIVIAESIDGRLKTAKSYIMNHFFGSVYTNGNYLTHDGQTYHLDLERLGVTPLLRLVSLGYMPDGAKIQLEELGLSIIDNGNGVEFYEKQTKG